MAKKKTNVLVWIGIAGIAGVAIYEYMKSKTAATATTSTSTGSDASQVASSVSVVSSGNGGSGSSTTAPSGITSDMYTAVQNWAIADGRIPVLAMAAANIPSEYAGMYDLIENWWGKKAIPEGSAQQIFWDG